MKKIIYLLLISLLISVVTAQIEPTVTNISSSMTYGSFSFSGSLDGVSCVAISSNQLWCYGNNVKHVYIFNAGTLSITNPYNLSNFDNGGAMGAHFVYYPTDGQIYGFGKNTSNYKINVSSGTETQLTENNVRGGYAECDLRPNTDEIYCWGDDDSNPATEGWIRVYNISADSWSYPLKRNYGTADVKADDYQSCDFVSDDVWVCYGGYNTTGNTESRLHEYNVVTNTSTIVNTGQPFTAGSCHAIESILYCTYGVDDDAGTPLDGIYYYNYTSDIFGTLNATLPIGFTLYGEAGLIDTTMYNLGGYVTNSYDMSNDVFKIYFDVPEPVEPPAPVTTVLDELDCEGRSFCTGIDQVGTGMAIMSYKLNISLPSLLISLGVVAIVILLVLAVLVMFKKNLDAAVRGEMR